MKNNAVSEIIKIGLIITAISILDESCTSKHTINTNNIKPITEKTININKKAFEEALLTSNFKENVSK